MHTLLILQKKKKSTLVYILLIHGLTTLFAFFFLGETSLFINGISIRNKLENTQNIDKNFYGIESKDVFTRLRLISLHITCDCVLQPLTPFSFDLSGSTQYR